MTREELRASLAPSPAAYLKAARAIEAGQISGLRKLRVAVLSTVTAELLAPYLRVEGALRGLNIEPWFAPFGQLEEQVLDSTAELYTRGCDAAVIIARLEELAPRIATDFLSLTRDETEVALRDLEQRLNRLIAQFRARSAAPLFIANFPPPLLSPAGLAEAGSDQSLTRWIEDANRALANCGRAAADVFVFDLARVAAEHGTRTWSDRKMWFLGRVPWSVSAQIAMAKSLARLLHAASFPTKKVLVLDLDGSLWGGVLGEDGIGGITLGDEYPGNVFKAFQQYLRVLRSRGVLLAIASKNNESDVAEVFARHADLVVRREDFAAVRINWREKSENLRAIATELNVGLAALVFFDDSAFEREEVRRAVPEVTVLDVPESPLDYVACIEESGCFDRLTLTSEDRARGEMYRQQRERSATETSASSKEAFLRSLQLVATIGTIDGETLPRVAQLLAKTNQFNLTTRRHSAAEIQQMLDAGAVGLWLRLADRLGDHGLVGVAIAVPENGGMRIDTFLLSCRVIGRAAEAALLAELATRLRAAGAELLVGEYLPTAKNSLVAEFYAQHGFAPDGENRWRFDLSTDELRAPEHLEIRCE